MKFYTWIIRYRLYLGIVLIVLGVVANIYSSFWPAFPAYFIGAILIFGHFFIGPLRLIQEHMEGGDLEGAKKCLIPSNIPIYCTNPSGRPTLPSKDSWP